MKELSCWNCGAILGGHGHFYGGRRYCGYACFRWDTEDPSEYFEDDDDDNDEDDEDE